jgi:peptide/nickel transport system substrate-binding protein
MTRLTHTRAAVLLAIVTALALGACGGDDEEAGKAGGSITVLHTAFPDALDPALPFSVDAWQALAQVYPGLLTYPHESGQQAATPVPGLAESLPTISEDGRTYTFKLREGLRFSDGKPVRASDFKHSIGRMLEQDSEGASFYTDIQGAEEFLKTKKGGVDGIRVDDATGEITINLAKPRGTFLYELAVPFAGIVPRDTPAENQTKNPPPGAGRYTIEDVEVGRSYKLVKNRSFSESLEGTAVDAGKVDAITAEVETEAANAATRVERNKADFMVDNPPPDRTAELKSKYEGERLREFPTNSTFYFFMNSEVSPFDKLEVRRAVNHAIDPDALNRIQGGRLVPSNNVLPPGVPGYEKSPDLYPTDLNKARALIKQAGAEGAKVTVWGTPETPTKQTVEYYADVLDQIGLEAEPKTIASETYGATLGDRAVKAQTGFFNWFQDYPHPADFIDLNLNPNNVAETGNVNLSYNSDDRELATKIEELSAEPELTDEVKQRWAELDREIQEKAYWAIYGNREQTTFFSERMDFENCKGDDHPVLQHDWAQFCLK